jgi:DNA repair photolyase
MTRTIQEEALRGRGASWNPANRFNGGQSYVIDESINDRDDDEARPDPRTVYLDDTSKSILNPVDSPDLPMGVNLNPYRGCEHGCIYCYARPTHEYFGYSAGLDFETKIFVKHRAPELLRVALAAKNYVPEPIFLSGITDVYQPAEHRFQITRKCLEVLAEHRHPVSLITKNRLITRDIDILKRLAEHNAVSAYISITTLDLGLNRILEPRSSSPMQRLDALRQLSDAGIRTGVMVAPVIPCITDHEIPGILAAAREAGAQGAGYILMRLPLAVAPLFEHWLEQHYPDRKDKVIHRIQDLRGGKLNDPRFGHRMRGTGPWAEQFRKIFEVTQRKLGYTPGHPPLNRDAFLPPAGKQLPLF